MKKGVCGFLALCVVLLLMVSCSPKGSGSQSADGKSGARAVVTMKVSNNQADTHPVNIAMTQFKKEVEEKTGGSIKVDLYMNGVLADDNTGREQVALGAIESAMIMGSSANIFEGENNAIGYIEELPFLFSDAKSARAAWDGELGDFVAKALESKGIKIISYWENGFRNLTNNRRPIVKPEDLKGIKLRIATSEMRQLTFQNLGATPVPMAFAELFTGLQQGTVDGQENPLAIIETSRFYEVQKYLSLSRHIYNTSSFIVNPAWFNGLSADEQQIILAAAVNARDYCRQLNDEKEATTLDLLKANGMEVSEINVAEFKAAVQPVLDQYVKNYGSDLIDIVRKYQ